MCVRGTPRREDPLSTAGELVNCWDIFKQIQRKTAVKKLSSLEPKSYHEDFLLHLVEKNQSSLSDLNESLSEVTSESRHTIVRLQATIPVLLHLNPFNSYKTNHIRQKIDIVILYNCIKVFLLYFP